MKTEVQVVYDNLKSVRRLLNMPFEKSMNKYKEFANVNISFVEINRIDDALRLLEKQKFIHEYLWIPCSVKMPCEKDGRVLVSMPNGEVRTAKYSEYGNGQWFIGDMMGVGGDKPVAWMPMPKPWDEM